MSTHPSVTDLAALAGPGAAPEPAIVEHARSCPSCRAKLGELREVTAELATAGTPPVPAAVAARLQATIAAEARRRAEGTEDAEARARGQRRAKDAGLGTFGPNPLTKAAPVTHQPRAHSG